MKTRREFLQTAAWGLTASPLYFSLLSCGKIDESKPLNVILILTDDQGYGDLGITGNPIIKTPNIDGMAKRSAQMKNFYVSPVCSPTRACLMTGRYNYRTRCVDTWQGRSMMDTEEVTIAEVLRNSGYATGIFGKWDLGDNYPMRPQDQGFEESLVHRGGGIGEPSDPPGGERKYSDPILFHNGQQVQEKGYCTDIYFNRAMQWMERTHQEKRNFFAYISTNAPHAPFHDVPQDLYERYKNINLNNDQFPQKIGHRLPDKSDTDRRARIYSMITNIDDNIGRLFKNLDALRLTDNTMVLFMVDNGPDGRRYVAGMKGMKTTVYEGGIHSPLFIHWPSKLQSARSSDRVVAHIDIFPTILNACDIMVPNDLKLDGRSFLPLLTGEEIQWTDRYIVIQSHRGDKPILYHNFAIRNQQWKLLHASGFLMKNFDGEPKFELYNMINDPLEMKNLADKRPEIVKQLQTAYEQWFEDVGSTRSDNYAPPRIYIGTTNENPVVLTRQHWRYHKGRAFTENSNGYWMLYAATSGNYDIRLRFHNDQSSGEATLKIGDQILIQSFSKGKKEITFKSVQLKKGDLNLLTTLNMDGITKGTWQADVMLLQR